MFALMISQAPARSGALTPMLLLVCTDVARHGSIIMLGHLSPQLRSLQSLVHPRHQPIEFFEVGRGQFGAGRTNKAAGDEPATAQNLLAHGKAKSGLLLMPHQ